MARTVVFGIFALEVCRSVGVELTYADVLNAADGVHALSIGPVPFLNYGFNSRGFNGGLPGPTFRMNPGETLQIDLTNNLLAANNVACSGTSSEYCDISVTNFHTHGLHVSSKGTTDGLAYNSDDVFAALQPQDTANYRFTIPDNHMPGTHWYHPHHHHATALQAGGGAAGALIVNDPVGYLPSEYAEMVEKVVVISGHDIGELEDMSQQAQSNLWSAALSAVGTSYIIAVNGMLAPTMTMASHVWHRFRMVFAAVEKGLDVSITGPATCQWKLLAKDGIYLDTIPRNIQDVHFNSGSRGDVAVSCECSTYPCDATLTGTLTEDGETQGTARDILLLSITQTSDGAVVTLPTIQLARPCYLVDLRSATVPTGNSGTLNLRENGGSKRVQWNGLGQSMTYQNVHANGGTMRSWPPLTTFQTGSIYEVLVEGGDEHPLHIHVNPYQLTAANFNSDTLGGYFQVGDWHDTLVIPGDTYTIRIQTDKFSGKAVVHCHILKHEDKGMMGFFEVGGTEGAMWTAAETVDATCYRGAWTASGVPSPTPASGATPAPGAATPAPGAATPAPGVATPAPSVATPAPGVATPAPGATTPAPGATTPAPGAATQAPGAATQAPGAAPAPVATSDSLVSATGRGSAAMGAAVSILFARM